MSAAELEPTLPGHADEVEAWESEWGELAKLGAFLRRDLLTAWSYRMAFLTDAGAIVFQALTFFFVGKMINPNVLPVYAGTHAAYMEFAAVGLLLTVLINIGLNSVAVSIRQEQLMGTLESILLTPTALGTVQVGSVIYSLAYIPVRTLLLFALIAAVFGLHFAAVGVLPALAILLLFLPFMWGLGIIGAAGMLTFRRGGMGMGMLSSLLVLGSGAFFPLTLMPHWIQTLSEANPIARAIEGMREALIGGTTAGLPSTLFIVGVSGILAFGLGLLAFKAALARERRRGTLGLY